MRFARMKKKFHLIPIMKGGLKEKLTAIPNKLDRIMMERSQRISLTRVPTAEMM